VSGVAVALASAEGEDLGGRGRVALSLGDPGDDTSLADLQDEARRGLPAADLKHRVLVTATGPRSLFSLDCVHKWKYTFAMSDDDGAMSVRDARAHFADVIGRAQTGSPTVITRNGEPVAAVIPIEDFNVLEDAVDRYFAREADRDLVENPDAPTYSMSEVVAAIFEEGTGRDVA
jgi:prevent-host-death family protein